MSATTVRTSPETRYQIEDPDRGRGGFGRVAKGFDTLLERPVAVKTLDPLLGNATDTDRARFEREARTLAQLRHPHIPSIYDVQFTENEFRIIFEFVERSTLRQLLNDNLQTLHVVRQWFIQIASALDHAHQNGIIHRDVKPDNIIIVPEPAPHAYLVDFGIALSLGDKRRISASDQILGTPGYMSPEQENGEELDPSDDVYSLGVTLYEALCGHRIPQGDYEELSTQNETIPPSVDALILKCIAPKHLRINSALEFARYLHRAMHTRVTLSDVLVEGHLHEIIAALREMDPNEFIQIKAGARLLVLNKALDVIENDDAKLDRARNEFLRILPVLAVHVDADRYQRIVSRALPMAFEHPYGKWIGDRDIREGLHEACVHAEANHGVLAEEFLSYLEKTTLEARPGWFYHAVRDVLVRLMTNTRCTDELANRLDQMLQRINRLQREATPTLGFGDLEKQPDTTTNAGRQAPEG